MSSLNVIEIMPYMNQRSVLGRVVINPPRSMAPFKERKVGEIKICCGRAFLSDESYNKHREERSEHLDHLWNDRLIPDDPSECSEATTLSLSTVEESPQTSKSVTPRTSKSGTTHSKTETKKKTSRRTLENQRKCHLCGILTSKSNYLRHLKINHSPSSKHKCRWCACVFPSKSNLMRHSVRTHPIDHKKYYWNSAAQNEKVNSARAKYIRQHNAKRQNVYKGNNRKEHPLKTANRLYSPKRKRDIKCIICGKIMANKCSFQLHLLIHSGDRPYKCKLCGFAFRHPNNLNRHCKKKHSDDCKFVCKLCPNRKYVTKESLMEHKKRQHKKECLSPIIQPSNRKTAIRLRSKTTTNFSKVEKALDSRVVMKMKPVLVDGGYQCKICLKVIKNIETYRGHILIHANLFPHKCSQCGQNFRLKSTLDTHVKTNHVENGNFKCEFCTCTFSLERALRRHVQCYHSGKRHERGRSETVSPQKAASSLRDISPDISTLGCRSITPLNHNLRSIKTDLEKKGGSPTHRQKNTPGKKKLNFLSGESVRSRNVTRALSKHLEETVTSKTSVKKKTDRKIKPVLQNLKDIVADSDSQQCTGLESMPTLKPEVSTTDSVTETLDCDSPDENLSLFDVRNLKLARSNTEAVTE